MPTTLGGLGIFVIFLTPGFLNYILRKRRVPQRSLSSLVELSTFVSISVLTNLLALCVFALVRFVEPRHTPDIERMLIQGTSYIFPRIGYIVVWAAVILATSCTFALLIGLGIGPIARLTPVIIDASAWYQVFESGPEDALVFVGCDLNDGSYVSGYLDWYNTDIDEVSDRDLVLAAPITVKIGGNEEAYGFERMILSARNIARLNVAFVTGE